MSHGLTNALVSPVHVEYTPRRVRVPASPRAGLQRLCIIPSPSEGTR
jgi:hypothetical protein